MNPMQWVNTGDGMLVGTVGKRTVFTITRCNDGRYYVVTLFGSCNAYYTRQGIISLTMIMRHWFDYWRETNKVLFEEGKK